MKDEFNAPPAVVSRCGSVTFVEKQHSVVFLHAHAATLLRQGVESEVFRKIQDFEIILMKCEDF
jgi:hypothetical protein